MKTFTLAQPIRAFGLVAAAMLLVTSCKKETVKDPLEDCRPASTGTGIGIPSPRNVMFWAGQDFQCGQLQFISVRNTTLNTYGYGGNATQSFITLAYTNTTPTCGANGTINIQVSKGYIYEYTISCTSSNRQWKGTFTADCSNDCIAIQLK
ncbi:MAG: hypothetical protein WKG07_08200 [Hymenobacter sp.]